MYHHRPIGVVDSGIGGMAVVAALKALLPYETICYVGDTAHLPYGDKTTAEICGYLQKIGNFLVEKNCKIIVIACVTATVAADAYLRKQVGPTIPVVNVVDPLMLYFQRQYTQQTWGLVATPYTIKSNMYVEKFAAASIPITLRPLATSQLAPAIENNEPIGGLLEQYLSDEIFSDIEGLILGCTHYWLVKEQFAAYYHHKLPVVSGAEWVAEHVRTLLAEKDLLEKPFSLTDTSLTDTSNDVFYVTAANSVDNLKGILDKIFPGQIPSTGLLAL